MQELVTGADSKKYLIVADHQPTDYKNQAASGVDLVVSGHTHGGQLFPFNQVGKWIGANDLVYGHEKHQNTDFDHFYRWEKTSNCEFWHFLPMGENIKLRILTISTDGRKGY
jgi:hypothetical protein